MKKILTLIISAVMILSSVQSVYALGGSDDVQKREILDALGIMSKDAEGEYVTREEFFGGLLGMFYETDEIYSVPKLSVLTGLLESEADEVYAPSAYITYNDAVAAAVTALGYEQQALYQGGYPSGYTQVAGFIGLLGGVSGSRTLSLPRESIVNLFYNMIDIEPYAVPYDTDGITYEIMENDTILSMQRDIYEISGIVSANQYTSLINPDGNAEKQITINGENFYIGETNAGDLLGMYVEGFVKRENDTESGEVIFLRPRENKTTVVEINGEDIISVSDTCDLITYDENNRTKTAKISKTVRVIYNGQFYDGYKAADLKPEMGQIRLIDNNKDKIYDCLFVTSYETMVASYTIPYNYEIFGNYAYSGALNYLKLEDKDVNTNIHYYLDGAETDITSIAKDDILTIQKSKSETDFIANVYISRNSVTGKYSSFDRAENEMTLNDVIYPVAEVFNKEIAVSGLQMTDSYTFYIDYFGNIVYAKKSVSTDYALFYKAYEDEDSDGAYRVNYMNDQSEWITANLAKKVKFNGVSTDSKAVFESIKALDPQIMLITRNGAGEINLLTVAEIGKKGEKLLAKTIDQNLRYRAQPKTFSCNIYLEPDVKVFVMPKTKSSDRDDYYATTITYFAGDTNYTIAAYDLDEFNFTGMVTVITDDAASGRVNLQLFVVTDIVEKLNEQGDIVSVIRGCMGNYVNLEFEGKNPDTFDGIKKGSIIRYHTNSKNKIDRWETLTPSNTSVDLWNHEVLVRGTVVANDYLGGKLKVDRGSELYLRHNPSGSVLIYDKSENICETGSYKDLIPGDTIEMVINWGYAVSIVIIRE